VYFCVCMYMSVLVYSSAATAFLLVLVPIQITLDCSIRVLQLRQGRGKVIVIAKILKAT